MINNLLNEKLWIGEKQSNVKLNELKLPVAPACNMMCNFCTKDNDCICNGNGINRLSRPMIPRQAVNWAVTFVKQHKYINSVRISGPAEPLCNSQTYEVLRRLNIELPGYLYCVGTNGLMLEEKAEELADLNVKTVEVSINAIKADTILKLYSRFRKGEDIIINSPDVANTLPQNQFSGIKRCVEMGMDVRVNTIYYPDINGSEIIDIAYACKKIGVKSMCLISGMPSGKLKDERLPSLEEMIEMKEKVSSIFSDIEIDYYNPL